ncbi:ABC transporter permease subunit [Synechococcus sp. Nb3U1]|uniref:ABC transporter permease n=1 Tax=Synechococcus sp. Nb3U1 TaxID=1914529 RepID=UPI001F263178|nr:ABC transporter permease subunit [Synechococcus sp. Nb3U1]MCF2971665.1 ABC transporter permease subunit [Synechococcus sp. Nb3U1]
MNSLRGARLALLKRYGPLLPALALVGLLYGGGLLLALAQSVGLYGLGASGFTLGGYGELLRDEEVIGSLGLSLGVAGLATGLSVLFGLGLALGLRGLGGWAIWIGQLTLPIPHLVGVAGMLLLLAPSGWLARLAFQVGWIASDQDFPLWVNDRGYVGVLLYWLWKEIPFAALVTLTLLRSLGRDLEQQARLLGASAWQSFWAVTLPLLRPGLLATGILIFGFVFSSFEIPFLLGPTYPRTLPVLIYQRFTHINLDQRRQAIALGLILLGVAAAAVSLAAGVLGQAGSRLGGDKQP